MRGGLAALVLLVGCLPEEASDPVAGQTRADAESGVSDAAAAAADAEPDAAVADPDAAAHEPDAGFQATVDHTCPGDPGCEAGPETALRVGAAARMISDLGYEKPLREYLELRGDCNELQGDRCGQLERSFLRNCGTDRLCEDDEGYPGPDEDGSEGDRDEDAVPYYDYFRDCGFDDICPGEDGYEGPDEGEGNKRFEGLWIAGFGLNRPAVGVHDHAWARTVAIEQGNTLLTITSVDAVGLFYDDVLRIRARAHELLAERMPEVDLDLAVVTATHSHEVPDTMGLWSGDVDPEVPIPQETGVKPYYIAQLRERAALSIVEAVAQLQPARMRVGRTHTGIDGLIRDSRVPRIVNDEMGVIRFADVTGDTIATLVNWGNHPETLGGDNNFISSDFAGPLRDGVEEGIPDSAGTEAREGLGGVCVYLQGTVGGLMTPLRVPVLDNDGQPLRDYSFERNDVYGWRLAEFALDAVEAGEDVASPAVVFTTSEFNIPVFNRLYHLGFIVDLFDRELYEWNDQGTIGPGNYPHVRTQIAIVRIGPVTMYTVPGELFPELAIGGYDGSHSFGLDIIDEDDEHAPDLSAAPAGPYLHDLMPGEYPWVLGLGNDELGYLVPPYDFVVHEAGPYLLEAPGDHYEETNSVGPEIVPRILTVLETLAAHLHDAGP